MNPSLGLYGTYPGKEHGAYFSNGSLHLVKEKKKGIMTSARDYDIHPSFSTNYRERPVINDLGSISCCGKCAERMLRPCVAEFLSVFFSIFVYNFIEEELLDRHVPFHYRIAMLSISDTILVLLFFTAFQTVHISPIITIAELFSLSSAWTMCILFLIIQIIASFGGFSVWMFVRSSTNTSNARILHDITTDWTTCAYRLVLSEFIGSLLVVMGHLIVSSKFSYGRTRLGQLNGSPLCIACGVFLSSYLSLLHSTVSWNPLIAFASSSAAVLHGDVIPLMHHYIFWIGPILGSLFACFLYRIVFAPSRQKRLRCTRCSNPLINRM
ncbi:hypothetical protein AB6A40_004298 [Gnathostoma spinigerum]|uniref:Aquaporin n=1 Tax=Gnathostoma spinigerum TaxID=75299 RepID=A0ABD6EHG0_9BILA